MLEMEPRGRGKKSRSKRMQRKGNTNEVRVVEEESHRRQMYPLWRPFSFGMKLKMKEEDS